MTRSSTLAILFAAVVAFYAAGAQAQLRPTDEETATGANNGVVAGPSGISQALPIARPADTLDTLRRDVGRTGGDQGTENRRSLCARICGPRPSTKRAAVLR